jgi:hypothetical protein
MNPATSVSHPQLPLTVTFYGQNPIHRPRYYFDKYEGVGDQKIPGIVKKII